MIGLPSGTRIWLAAGVTTCARVVRAGGGDRQRICQLQVVQVTVPTAPEHRSTRNRNGPPYIDRLALLDVNAVKYVLAYYRNERQAMEKRGASLSGAVDRIGLFPAIGAVALLYYGLLKIAEGSEVGVMLSQLLVSVIAVFHLFNFVVMPMYQKMDRIIAMLEYSVDSRP